MLGAFRVRSRSIEASALPTVFYAFATSPMSMKMLAFFSLFLFEISNSPVFYQLFWLLPGLGFLSLLTGTTNVDMAGFSLFFFSSSLVIDADDGHPSRRPPRSLLLLEPKT